MSSGSSGRGSPVDGTPMEQLQRLKHQRRQQELETLRQQRELRARLVPDTVIPDGFVACPFDPAHCVPAEFLTAHVLRHHHGSPLSAASTALSQRRQRAPEKRPREADAAPGDIIRTPNGRIGERQRHVVHVSYRQTPAPLKHDVETVLERYGRIAHVMHCRQKNCYFVRYTEEAAVQAVLTQVGGKQGVNVGSGVVYVNPAVQQKKPQPGEAVLTPAGPPQPAPVQEVLNPPPPALTLQQQQQIYTQHYMMQMQHYQEQQQGQQQAQQQAQQQVNQGAPPPPASAAAKSHVTSFTSVVGGGPPATKQLLNKPPPSTAIQLHGLPVGVTEDEVFLRLYPAKPLLITLLPHNVAHVDFATSAEAVGAMKALRGLTLHGDPLEAGFA